ncbi:Guanylate-binding protein 1 [Frankliniella fusca]|uniref:Guanylate-binding protein 1 n=1 Tax=Frankliniella fusca TaxID=407009 RepID=A0AAE1HF52_9NEOP|nr:Guanylate-binding protein 1 [Frankliniella fusca]
MDPRILDCEGQKYIFVPDDNGGRYFPVGNVQNPQLAGPGPSSGVIFQSPNEVVAAHAQKRPHSSITTESSEVSVVADSVPKKMRAPKAVWKDEEVSKLLELCILEHIVEKKDGQFGRLPHYKIFEKLSEDLNACRLGPPKTPEQVKNKFEHLKKDYTNAKIENNRSGNGRMTVSDLDNLKTLFGNRPNVTVPGQYGFESQELSEQSVDDPSASSTSATSNKKPCVSRYKSGRKNATVMYLQDLREQDEQLMKEFQRRSEENLEKMQQADAEMLQSLSSSLMGGLKDILGTILPQTQPQVPQAQLQVPQAQTLVSQVIQPPLNTSPIRNMPSPVAQSTPLSSITNRPQQVRIVMPKGKIIPPNSKFIKISAVPHKKTEN